MAYVVIKGGCVQESDGVDVVIDMDNLLDYDSEVEDLIQAREIVESLGVGNWVTEEIDRELLRRWLNAELGEHMQKLIARIEEENDGE